MKFIKSIGNKIKSSYEAIANPSIKATGIKQNSFDNQVLNFFGKNYFTTFDASKNEDNLKLKFFSGLPLSSKIKYTNNEELPRDFNTLTFREGLPVRVTGSTATPTAQLVQAEQKLIINKVKRDQDKFNGHKKDMKTSLEDQITNIVKTKVEDGWVKFANKEVETNSVMTENRIKFERIEETVQKYVNNISSGKLDNLNISYLKKDHELFGKVKITNARKKRFAAQLVKGSINNGALRTIEDNYKSEIIYLEDQLKRAINKDVANKVIEYLNDKDLDIDSRIENIKNNQTILNNSSKRRNELHFIDLVRDVENQPIAIKSLEEFGKRYNAAQEKLETFKENYHAQKQTFGQRLEDMLTTSLHKGESNHIQYEKLKNEYLNKSDVKELDKHLKTKASFNLSKSDVKTVRNFLNDKIRETYISVVENSGQFAEKEIKNPKFLKILNTKNISDKQIDYMMKRVVNQYNRVDQSNQPTGFKKDPQNNIDVEKDAKRFTAFYKIRTAVDQLDKKRATVFGGIFNKKPSSIAQFFNPTPQYL